LFAPLEDAQDIVYFSHMTTSIPSPPVADLETLIASMSPRLNSGTFAFISVDGERKPAWENVVAAIREPEGLALVVPLEVAEQGAYHDHIFVPHEQASEAMAVLVSLQRSSTEQAER
jgi:hypothetical protein